MNILDIRTILFSYTITNAICATVIATLWFQSRRRSPGLGLWLADFILQFVAVLLIALRGILPNFISVLFGTPLVIAGTLLLYIGLERYTGKVRRQLLNYILLGAVVILQAWFTFIQPSLQARNLILSAGLLGICSECAWLLLHRVDPSMRANTRAVGLVFMSYSLVNLARIFIDLVVRAGNNLLQSDIYDTLVILIYQMIFIGLTFALFLMVNRRLFGALEEDNAERKRVDEALQASEVRYRSLIEQASDGIFIADAQGRYIDVNPRGCEMLGYSCQELLELSMQDVVSKEEQEANPLRLNEMREGKTIISERHMIRKDQSLLPVEISGKMLPDGRMIGFVRDITERKRQEKEIQVLSRFPGENPNPILRIARSGRILYANPGSEPILSAWGRVVDEDIPSDWRERIESASTTGISTDVEIDCQGQIFLCTVTPIANEGYVNIYGINVTVRRKAEEDLRETRDYLDALLNYANAPIIVWDPEFTITRFNHAFERLTGLTAEEVIGKHLKLLFPVKSRKGSLDLIAHTMNGDRMESVEIPILHREGNVRVVLWNSASLLSGNSQTLVATIAQGQDITERKEAEEEIQRINAQLEERVEQRTRELREAQEKLVRSEKLAMLGQLSGSVSHELRNPLGVISNAVYYLKMAQPDVDAKVINYLDIIEKETRTADKIITDLLDYSRIKSLDQEPVAVADLVAEVLKRYPVPLGLECTLKIPKNLPRVKADPDHLVQILGNLVVNAYQAMPDGSQPGGLDGKLVISAKRTEANGITRGKKQAFVAIAVKDSGVGISPGNLGKIFEPLFTTKARGIGLGLPICKSLVEANGGQIEVQSEQGRGSTFTIYLPTYKEAI